MTLSKFIRPLLTGITAITFVTAIAFESSGQAHSYFPPAGFVPNEVTAIRIAKAVLTPVYGEDKIRSEEPFVATLKDGIWTVEGQLAPGLAGGVALVEISKVDGKIIRMTHGK